MDYTTALLIALGIFAIVAVVLVIRYSGSGRVKIKNPLGSFEASGANPPPPTAIPAGATSENVTAKGDVLTQSSATGGAASKGVESGGKVTTLHTPGEPPPKP